MNLRKFRGDSYMYESSLILLLEAGLPEALLNTVQIRENAAVGTHRSGVSYQFAFKWITLIFATLPLLPERLHFNIVF